MSLIMLEVEINHGSLTVKEPERLPERAVGVLTIVQPDPVPPPKRGRVQLPLIRGTPGTVINPTPEELDESLWGN